MRNPILSFGLLILLIPAAGLWAGNIDVGASWLKVPTSAESAGLGGAFSAVGTDVNTLGLNPAGLGLMDGQQLSLMHNIWVQDLSTEHAAYGQAFPDQSGGAVGVDYINFGSVDKYTISSGAPVAAGSYSPMAANVEAGYGRLVAPNLLAGADLRFLTQNLNTTSSSTMAGDLGLLYRMPKEGASFAMVLSNLGGNLDAASLPALLRLGAAYQKAFGDNADSETGVKEHLATLSAEGDLSLDSMDASSFSLGGEYWYKNMLAARLGYHFDSYGGLTGLAGLSLGAGVRYKNFELDYALTALGDLGTSHQLSLLTHL